MTAADGLTAAAIRRRPPGPRAIAPLRPLVAAACGAGYLAAGEWLVRRLFASYGPVVSIPLPGIPVVLIKDPALVKQVFTEKPDILLGGQGVRPSALIYGTGSMFVQEEPEHLRRRKLLTPPLHGKALENYRPIIEDSTRRAIATWPRDEPFKMLRAARELALDVILRVCRIRAYPRWGDCRSGPSVWQQILENHFDSEENGQTITSKDKSRSRVLLMTSPEHCCAGDRGEHESRLLIRVCCPRCPDSARFTAAKMIGILTSVGGICWSGPSGWPG